MPAVQVPDAIPIKETGVNTCVPELNAEPPQYWPSDCRWAAKLTPPAAIPASKSRGAAKPRRFSTESSAVPAKDNPEPNEQQPSQALFAGTAIEATGVVRSTTNVVVPKATSTLVAASVACVFTLYW